MSKNIKIVIISVLCLLLATVLGLGGTYGYVTLKANNDVKMQEQYSAGYDSRADEIAELEAERQDKDQQIAIRDAKIIALQEQLSNAIDPAEIATLNAQIAELQKQIEELQKNTGSADYSAIENGDCKVVTFKVDDDVHAVKVVEKGATVTVNDPQAPSAIQGLTSKVEWNLNGTPVDLSTYAVTENIILDAKFKYSSNITLEKMDWNAGGHLSLSQAHYFNGADVWSDGIDYYYSSATDQYVLDISTYTWHDMVWNGLSAFAGSRVWSDGSKYYYSSGSKQYVLNVSTHTWSVKTWNGYASLVGKDIWTDGIDFYYSDYPDQYVLDVTTSTWSKMIWNGLSSYSGSGVWTDGINYYYSSSSGQYVLDIATHTWSKMTWNGFSNISGANVWSDGVNYYYSVGSAQYVLDKSTHTWCEMTWSGYSTLAGGQVWTDGTDRYYSYQNNQYVFKRPETASVVA